MIGVLLKCALSILPCHHVSGEITSMSYPVIRMLFMHVFPVTCLNYHYSESLVAVVFISWVPHHAFVVVPNSLAQRKIETLWCCIFALTFFMNYFLHIPYPRMYFACSTFDVDLRAHQVCGAKVTYRSLHLRQVGWNICTWLWIKRH